MPTSPDDWASLRQGVQGMRRVGQEQQQRGLLGQATEMMGHPGGVDFQGMMGLAQQAPKPMEFMQQMGQMFQMKNAMEQKEILSKAGNALIKMYDDNKFTREELIQVSRETGLDPKQIIVIAQEIVNMGAVGQPKQPDPYTLSAGAARYDGNGNILAYNPKTGEDETVVYGSDGQPIFRKGPAAGRQKEIGTIPPGFKAIRNEAGNVIGMEALPGGPAAIEAKEKEEQIKVGKEGQAKAAQTVYEDVDRAMMIIDEYGRAATGFMGLSDFLPEVPAARLDQHIKSIQGNIGIDKLLEIKKSGAGLGQVPQAQLEMLASVLGRLDTKMNKEDLIYNLKRVQEIYKDIAVAGGLDPDAVYKRRKEEYGTVIKFDSQGNQIK